MTTKEKILKDAKENRTRKAEINGNDIFIKIYAQKELELIIASIVGNQDDQEVAAVLSKQFLDESGSEVFSAKFFLSDDCTPCYLSELCQLFLTVNSGNIKKK